MKITLLFLLMILDVSVGFGQWIENSNTITASFLNCSVAYEGKVYFTGGSTTQAVTQTPYNSQVQILDLTTNEITTAAGGLSVGRGGISCAAYGGKIYFAGGYKYVNNSTGLQAFSAVDVYDIATGDWDTLQLSIAKGAGAVAVVNGAILFAGGVTVINSQAVSSDVVDIYYPDSDMWGPVMHLSQPRGDFQAGVKGHKAWFCGGATNWNSYVATTRVDVYDADSLQWHTAELSMAREAVAVTVAGKYLLCAGGFNGTQGTQGKTNRVDILNTENGHWSTATLSSPRSAIAAATLGSKAYFTGGGTYNVLTGYLSTSTNAVDIFEATDSIWSVGALNKNRTAHTCAAWGNKIAVGGGWRAEQMQTTGSVEVLTDSTFVAVKSPSRKYSFSIFPNPAKDALTIQLSENQGHTNYAVVRILNVSGQILRRHVFENILSEQVKLDLNGLSAGDYFLEMELDGQPCTAQKFLIMGN